MPWKTGKPKNVSDLWMQLFGNRTQLYDRPARSWGTVLTELSRLHFGALTLVNKYLKTEFLPHKNIAYPLQTSIV